MIRESFDVSEAEIKRAADLRSKAEKAWKRDLKAKKRERKRDRKERRERRKEKKRMKQLDEKRRAISGRHKKRSGGSSGSDSGSSGSEDSCESESSEEEEEKFVYAGDASQNTGAPLTMLLYNTYIHRHQMSQFTIYPRIRLTSSFHFEAYAYALPVSWVIVVSIFAWDYGKGVCGVLASYSYMGIWAWVVFGWLALAIRLVTFAFQASHDLGNYRGTIVLRLLLLIPCVVGALIVFGFVLVSMAGASAATKAVTGNGE
jgi:hypothetical protein